MANDQKKLDSPIVNIVADVFPPTKKREDDEEEDAGNYGPEPENEQEKPRANAVDRVNNLTKWAKRAKWASRLFGGGAGAAGTGAGAAGAAAGGTAAGAGGAAAAGTATAPVWVPVAVVAVIILIIILLIFFKPSAHIPSLGGGGNDNTGGGGGPGATCGVTGSLDYSIDFRDKSILPKDEFAIQDQVVARWPAAALYNWSKIVSRSIDAGWNPSFILALWIEESGAQGEPGYTDALGCDPKHPTKDIDKSLTCVFNSFKDTSGFEDLMCLYGGDGFHKAPCTFNMENPNFPGGVKDWYLKLAGGITNGSKDSNSCLPSQPGDWPTEGTVYQGPKGASDHARLYDQGLEAIDIANASGPPVYTSFDGVANAHGCITEYGDCGVHYGNFVDVVSNNGAFTVRYGHLSQFSISDGQSVKAGDQIGIMGSTGASTGTHLHWEFRGIKMEPPNIPQAIEPFNCDNDLGPSCGNPSSVIRGSPSQPGV